MANQINQIAHRIRRWANSSSFPVEKTAGYCMSGSWDNFYSKLLFPGKILQVDVLKALIEKLKQLGFYAFLAVSPIENGSGLYMYMQLRVIKPSLVSAELPILTATAKAA